MGSKHILVGVDSGFSDFPRISVGKIAYDNMKRFGDKTAIVNGVTGKGFTFVELLDMSLKLYSVFKQLGLKKGDTISILSENDIEYYVVYISALFAGIVLNNLNPNYTKFELTRYLSQTKSKLIFCTKNAFPVLQRIKVELRYIQTIILLNGEPERDVTNLEAILTLAAPNFATMELESVDVVKDTALILYSSGSSGHPKGVLLTHQNLRMPLIYMGDNYFNSKMSCTYLHVTPCTHIIGTMIFAAMIGHGSTLVFLPKFQPNLFLSCIKKYNVNSTVVVPQIILFLIKSPLVDEYDISCLKNVFCGAAMLSKDNIEQFLRRFLNCTIRQVYGLTETTGVCVTNTIKNNNAASIGKLIVGDCCKISDIETGAALGPNEPGEICIKGDSTCKGYNQNEEANLSLWDREGFLRTGDIGYYDENGFIYITDRLKEIIKHKGYQVSPTEIEYVLLLHEDVKEAGVIGVPSLRNGENAIAFVSILDGRKVTDDELKTYVAEQLCSYKVPEKIYIIDEIPKNTSSKVDKLKLREIWKNMAQLQLQRMQQNK